MSDNAFDSLVPDTEVQKELGTNEMGMWRRDHDPRMAELGWPLKIKIGRLNYRQRSAIEAFKANVVRRAFTDREAAGAA
jgi:hypothetical protein